jgi:hypothetical protein
VEHLTVNRLTQSPESLDSGTQACHRIRVLKFSLQQAARKRLRVRGRGVIAVPMSRPQDEPQMWQLFAPGLSLPQGSGGVSDVYNPLVLFLP